MKSGLIIYSEEDIERNKWFIDKCLKELNNELFSLKLIEEKVAFEYIAKNKIDYAINRSRNHALIKSFEEMGIVCFNNSLTNEIANDKSKTVSFCKENCVRCLDIYDINTIDDCPFVMKSVDGHGGKEVYLLNDKQEAEKILKKSHKKYIFQKYIKNSGDLRIYVLGNKVLGAVLRQNERDFRSNYSLGGSVLKYEPDVVLKQIALRISKRLNADFIGIDFLKTNEGFILNEIEDPVGSRMLYETSDIDAIGLFIKHIKEKMSK